MTLLASSPLWGSRASLPSQGARQIEPERTRENRHSDAPIPLDIFHATPSAVPHSGQHNPIYTLSSASSSSSDISVTPAYPGETRIEATMREERDFGFALAALFLIFGGGSLLSVLSKELPASHRIVGGALGTGLSAMSGKQAYQSFKLQGLLRRARRVNESSRSTGAEAV